MKTRLKTWEGPKVLDTTMGAPTNMKGQSKILKLVKHFKRDGLAMKKPSRMSRTCSRPLLAFAVSVYLGAVEANSALQGEIFTLV